MGKAGKSCCMVGCRNYYTKTTAASKENNDIDKVSYFGFPKKGVYDDWRGKLIAFVKLTRADNGFNPDNQFICSDHFERKSLLFHGKGYKLVPNSLPTLNLPVKSCQREEKPSRKAPLPREPPVLPERVKYLSFNELVTDGWAQAQRTESSWAVLRAQNEHLVLGLVNDKTQVVIKVSFQGSFVGQVTHLGFVVNKPYDVEETGLSSLLAELEKTKWCKGSTPRAAKCPLIVEVEGLCKFCTETESVEEMKQKQSITKYTPLASATKTALIQEVKSVRGQLKNKSTELVRIQEKLKTETVLVEDDVKEGLNDVLAHEPITDPFLKLFWEEQKKAAGRDPRGMRWHPMLIRFAIYLHYHSSRAYDALRDMKILRLPNKSTLRDYTNVFRPHEGHQSIVFEELRQLAEKLPEENQYVAVMHDEMSIRNDLVYDHRGGEMVGFVNPAAWDLKEGCDTAIATHVLVFMAVGINNNIKKTVAYFATKTATSDMLYPLLWETVAYLEQAGLKVITSTSDKASPNQRLYRMHGEAPVVHETVNPFTDDLRPIFFISDAPHLIKTLRNNLESSRAGGTRYMWKNGQHILWEHIREVHRLEVEEDLFQTGLRQAHVRLTPSSRMSVRLAAQVLSHRVAVAVRRTGDDRTETALFLDMCNTMFDCLNARSFREAFEKRNDKLEPYRDRNDPRFEFLQSFADYLEGWRREINQREGFTPGEKEKMSISHQTFEGALTTIRGFTGAARYLLDHGVPYVFSNIFCQDPLEQHFGRHRGLGRRGRNPSLYEFGHQENKLRIQRTLAFKLQPKGNVRREHADVEVDETPMPKVRRH